MRKGDAVQVAIRSLDFAHQGRTGPTAVFEGLDLEIETRTLHAIVGPSGCGKSTLLRLIGGLERPDRGTITFSGRQEAANRVAFVFQDPTLVPGWDVGRNVGTGVEFDRRRRPLYNRIRDFNLDRVGLRQLRHRRPHSLSLGQQTRASIGRALAYDADVTLLDEPFVHLDAVGKRRMWEEFETFWQLEARTYVLVTHDIDEAVLLSDRVTVLTSTTPTEVADTIEVGLPRPRRPASMEDPAFRSAVSRVWAALDQRCY